MSTLQVATPPLSPANLPPFDELLDQHLIEDDNQDYMFGAEITESLPYERSRTSAYIEEATAGSKPAVVQSPPKMYGWPTYYPGAPFVPMPKTGYWYSGRPRGTRKPNHLRLHERFPIVLPPEAEAKLSMEMVDLFESLLPTEESHIRRTKLIQKIEDMLHTEWPGHDIKALPFGSTVNDLGTSSSDVDICIMTTWPGLKNVQMLANAFRKYGMEKVFCVPRAKVPIVRIWDPELHLSCDVNINTPLGVLNSEMIKTYVAIDPRVRPFAMIIKHWARKRVLNDAANGGTISTYTWICIVINFLQMRSPPILPQLHKIPHTLSEDNQVINGNNTSFCRDIEKLEGFGLPNKETLGGLLYAFFRRFAIEFDYDHHVISVREGCYLTKESKGWHLPGKHYKLFCVEEPFDTSRNLGNSSDLTNSMGLKEEFRRVLEILHHKGSLNECCDQFMFPASYYSSNTTMRKVSNGPLTYYGYAPGRRYVNGYRSLNNYDDDDYGDDDDDDDNSVKEVSVMETLNIGTRPSTSLEPTGNSKYCFDGDSGSSLVSKRGSGKAGSEKPRFHKDGTLIRAGTERTSDPSNHGQSRNRAKQGKGEKQGTTGSAKSGSSRNSKQAKSSASGSAGQRSKKSKKDRGKNGNGSRGPRATVEFSLADIAKTAPKFLSEVGRSDQEPCSQATDTTSGSVTGEESSGGFRKRKDSRRNVVWSTNSNRGESARRPSSAKTTQALEHEKTKMIYVVHENDPSCPRIPPALTAKTQEP
ncbi:hypothetical protein BGX34_005144 [Mortierella sp. NVP85]|nr:hypothetical protein BGX34_005144 [Mortierella sp. NVP85]